MYSNSTQSIPDNAMNRLFAGFKPLLKKEFTSILQPRAFIMRLISWTVFLNGFLLMTLLLPQQFVNNPDISADERAEMLQLVDNPIMGVMAFFVVAGIAITIAAIITLQDAIVQEKQMGTAAWILSKPVTRTAFILSKIAGHTARMVIVVLLPQSLLAFIQLRLIGGAELDILNYLFAVSIMLLFVVSFSSLTLMLGTFFDSRTWIIGIPIFLIIAYQPILTVFAPIANMLPYSLLLTGFDGGAPLIMDVVVGQPITSILPILFTGLYTLLFTGIAIWRFGREEL